MHKKFPNESQLKLPTELTKSFVNKLRKILWRNLANAEQFNRRRFQRRFWINFSRNYTAKKKKNYRIIFQKDCVGFSAEISKENVAGILKSIFEAILNALKHNEMNFQRFFFKENPEEKLNGVYQMNSPKNAEKLARKISKEFSDNWPK